MIVRKFDLHRNNAPDRTFRIFAALLHRTLGDFVDQLLFVATVKQMFPNARLDVHYRPDRPYKADLIALAPQVDQAWPMAGGMPMDYFDTAGDPPVTAPEAFYESLCHYADLILTPGMCRFERMAALGEPARFALPDAERWEHAMAAKVGPGWFAVIHYREPGYGQRPDEPVRDFNPDDAVPVYDAILQAGGQVVRIGHPGMTALPKREGLIDLSADGLMTQVAAIRRARFFLELSPSGPAHLALPFGCPLLRCNQSSIGRTFSDRAVAMPQRVIDGSGNDVTLEILQRGAFGRRGLEALPDHRLQTNSTEQLLEGTAMMIRHTRGDGWRALDEDCIGDPPGHLSLPLDNRLDLRLMV